MQHVMTEGNNSSQRSVVVQSTQLGITAALESAAKLVLSGMELVEAKSKQGLESVTRQAGCATGFIVLGWFGLVAILMGLMIELGRYWEGRYGLSAMVVGTICLLLATALFAITKKISRSP